MIKGIHHIGAAVQDLDEAVAFYHQAVDLERLVGLDETANHQNHRTLYQSFPLHNGRCRSMFLGGNTTYLELTQFEHPTPEPHTIMPVNGPGITHVCFQAPADNGSPESAFNKFKRQGLTMVSRQSAPAKLSRRDITYVYARDRANNMFEVEQWDDPPMPFPIWIAHVALVSPNIERLTNFYSMKILGMDAPPEIRHVNGIPNLDVVANLDDVDLYGTWISTANIMIEIWQYINPPTPDIPTRDIPKRDIPKQDISTLDSPTLDSPTTDSPVHGALDKLGYTHICFEVADMAAEVTRLAELGVPLLSEPYQSDGRITVMGHDPDGNLFELLQFLDPAAPLSLA